MIKNSINKSYSAQENHYDDLIVNGELSDHAKTWLLEGTIDDWRHKRMYCKLDPLIDSVKNPKWLTVGDGRMGSDAHYLESKGVDVIATDISDTILSRAYQLGFIKKFRKENAEHLSFNDEEFDFALCKESYHHFPRPYIAVYEMLRVAKKGIVLIEPADQYVDSTILQIPFRNLKNYLRKKLKNRSIRNDFETSGNYVYRLSKREIEKLAYGLSLKTIAFFGMNDYFIPGIGTTKIDEPSKGFTKLKAVIKLQDILCGLGLLKPSILIAVIFKENIDNDLKENLKKHNFEVIDLEKNPYLE